MVIIEYGLDVLSLREIIVVGPLCSINLSCMLEFRIVWVCKESLVSVYFSLAEAVYFGVSLLYIE